jgi:hypothetical protein
LYLIGAAGTGDGTARHAAALVERTLAASSEAPATLEVDEQSWECGWLAGDPRWFSGLSLVRTSAAEAPAGSSSALPFVPTVPGARRRSRLTPSGRESHVLTAGQLFSVAASPARELGLLVHALFERIEDPGDSSAMESWRRLEHPEPAGWQRDGWGQVLACLEDSSVGAFLRLPVGARLWREKRFEVILDGEWVTGTFDRVVVAPDQALIIDFKTDDVADEAAARHRADGYRPQIDLYRRVVGMLTGLDSSVIRAALVFTRRCGVVEIR